MHLTHAKTLRGCERTEGIFVMSMNGPDVSGMRVLMVDDDPMCTCIVATKLETAGFTAVKSQNDSTRVLQACWEFRPDLLVVDRNMPGRNGLEVLQDIAPYREAKGYFPVLMLTSDTAPDAEREALRLGATDFVSKNLDFDLLELRIRNLLKASWIYERVPEARAGLERTVAELTRAPSDLPPVSVQLRVLRHG